ncbi:MAG: hypothetical protein CL610_09620 [Anaerolineaceae bacterium]|nr:hypothetical protein [Anaerolineaceae bacterium]
MIEVTCRKRRVCASNKRYNWHAPKWTFWKVNGMFGRNRIWLTTIWVILVFIIAACNLTSEPQQQLDLTDVPTNTVLPTRTLITTGSAPTPVTVTSLPLPTQIGQRPTAVLPPPVLPFPTPSPMPVNIAILSPGPGSVVAGNVQVIGAASHPSFLQYQLEWGPDPNPGDLWFLASGIVQNPVFNGLLGIWNTSGIQDGQYQLRLKVFLRDGTNLATVVNNVRVQNRVPTIAPTATTVSRPIAAFSQDRVSGISPLVVRFFNQSSGNITSYSWNFGDGGSSSAVNPTHTFRNPGVYNVTLRVKGPGGSSNVSRQISVQSATPPVAAFTQDRTSGASPLTIQFTDQSQGNITQRVWNFGDNTTSNQTNPTHTFDAVGTYNVILTVTGSGGSSSVTRQITVENPTIPEPIAALVPSQTEGEAPLTVQFDATDSSGQIDSYNWNFGDGQLGGGRIVTHTFDDPGLYEVLLVVVGPGGQSEARVEINVVQPPDAPVAAIAANPMSGEVSLTVQFNASSSTGPIDSYTWNFGDGEIGEGAQVQHTYNAAGTYTVELFVQGPGGSDKETVQISAVEPIEPPTAAFESSPSSGPAPLEVQFTNQSEGDELTFEWNFGDGSEPSSDRDPLHIYENAGEYTVTLIVSGPGGTDEAQGTITVIQPDEPPVAAFDVFPQSGPAPLEVQFTNQAAGEELTFEWNFGDATDVSTARDPLHTYQSAGEYTVRLTVTGPGGSSSAEKVVSVTAPIPDADPAFTADPTSGEAPLTVNFDSTGDPNNISSYFWEFGDGGISNTADPQHIYSQQGNYTARLTVTGVNGRSAFSEVQIAVSEAVVIAPPAVAFRAEPANGTTNEPVQFVNETTGEVTSYEWQFGDGATSGEQSPTHTYGAAGEYTVSLRAVGPGGENTAQISYTVADAAQPPVAAFRAEPASGTTNEPVQFVNETTGEVTSYEWQFGDGATSGEQSPTHTYGPAGEYTVTLRAVGPGGENTAQITYSVTDAAQPPVAAFRAEPASGTTNEPVQFINETTGEVTSYEWQFGDGATSGEQSPTHTYGAAGEYTVSLRAVGPGGENTAQITYSVADAAQPPVAAFHAEPASGTTNEPVQFINETTGEVTSYEWQFGDGATSGEQSPTHTYGAAGEYTVSLRAVGPGGENTAQITYTVADAAQPPVAAFRAEPTSGTTNEPVQFINETTGEVTSYEWQFGDGATSGEQSPTHTYGAAGEYTVTLRAVGPGGENTAQITYTVADAAQSAPNLVEQIPNLPDLSPQQVRNQIRAIFDSGVNQGKRANVFTVIGGTMAVQSGYLEPFADPGINTGAPELQSTIDWFNQVDLGDGRSSFDRDSLAAGVNWRAQDLLDPSLSSGGNCNPGETPLDCEIRLVQPAVAIISVGMGDIASGTDPQTYRASMEQIIQTLLNNGVIPVVTTVQPNPANESQVTAINNALVEAVQNVEAANNTTVPIYNLWRKYTNQLPNNGLEGDNTTPTVAPGGPGLLSPDTVGTYATNTRNRDVLTLLEQLHSQIFPDAAP